MTSLYGFGVPGLWASGFGGFEESFAGVAAGPLSGDLGAGVGAGAGAGDFGVGGCGSGPSARATRTGAARRAARARSRARWLDSMVSPVLPVPPGRQAGWAAFGKARQRAARWMERAPHGLR